LPLPDLNTRIYFLTKQIEEAQFTNGINEKAMQTLGRGTALFSFRDLQRFWNHCCDILFSQLRSADHFRKTGDDFCCFVPCNCEGVCDRYEKENVVRDAVEMIMTGDIMVKALSEVTTLVDKENVNKEEAGNAEEEESNGGEKLCCLLVLFIVKTLIFFIIYY